MERRFGINAVDATGKLTTHSSGNPYLGNTLGWSALLESQRILLVAEAGAGKTHECEAQARALFERGEPAFFLRLETVAANGIRAALLDEDIWKRFDDWRASSSQIGYFFLDSIDELQLAHGDFRDALKRVQEDLKGALGRATIVVTSRPVDIDRRAFAEVLPALNETVDELRGEIFVRMAMHGQSDDEKRRSPDYREVTLLPFSDAEIVEFARAHGVETPEQLLKEIRARNAQEFARRPQELLELCDGWREHAAIRSHYEQLEGHVQTRLRSQDGRKELTELSTDRARAGVQRLALAAMLSRRLTIRHSDHADLDGSGDEALTPATLLKDFSASEIDTLLQRPIFADGGYGRVRFHHRSVLEFLAAAEMDRLIGAGLLAVSAAMRMLFSLSDNSKLLPKPSMRPVAAWLAKMRQAIFEAVLEVEPSTLLLFGDAESLSDDQCAQALRAYVARHGAGQWRGLEVPSLQLDRLARKPLDHVIMDVWSAGIENPEVRLTVLQLIAAGRYSKCADLAAAAATRRSGNDRERFEALETLVELKDYRATKIIEAVASSRPGWNPRIGRWIAQNFYPRNLTEGQLVRLLAAAQRAATVDDFFPSGMAAMIERADVSSSRLEQLLPDLLALTRSLVVVLKNEDSLGDRKGRLQVSYMLRGLCVRLLEEGSRAPDLIEAAVLGFRAAGYSSFDSERKLKLAKLLNELTGGGRRAVFEADFACVSRLESRRSMQGLAARLMFQGPMQYGAETDGSWILAELREVSAAKARRSLLLRMLVYVVPADATRDIASIRAAVADSTTLVSELTELLQAREPMLEVLTYQERERGRTEKLAAKQEREKAAWTVFWNELDQYPALALAPGQVENTIWNVAKVLRQRSRGSDGGRWDRGFLERTFKKPVIEVLRLRLMNYWREMTPKLPSEREDKNTYLTVWTIGLMGLYAEAEDAQWTHDISEDNADRAIRYALVELNGLPDWLAAVASAQPRTVERVLGNEIDIELAGAGGDNGWHSMLLQSLRYSRREIAEVLEPRLIQWLRGSARQLMRAHTPAGEGKIDQVVRILLVHGSAASQQWLAEVATREATATGDGPFFHFWLSVVMRLCPPRGAALLLHALQKLPVEASGAAVKAIGALFRDWRAEGSADWSKELRPDILLRLNQAIYRHVDPKADVRHEGAYSPGPRDNAEDGRRHVFDALIHAAGTEAYQAKLALSTDPLFAHARDRIQALAQERLAEETDASVSSEEDLARLFQGGELAPSNSADMAHLLHNRLDDLQALVVSSTSARASWSSASDESALRKALAVELEKSSRGAFEVEGDYPAIGLRAIAENRASIVLKIGEVSDSGKELRDIVETELAQVYMSAGKARTGCVVVTVSRTDKRWVHPDSGETMDRHQLQTMLNSAAQVAQQRLAGEGRVMARVLNLTTGR
jgi:hypothetical protein